MFCTPFQRRVLVIVIGGLSLASSSVVVAGDGCYPLESIGSFDLPSFTRGIYAQGTTVYAAASSSGLQILDASDP
ncbi:MAG: hypothetical protein COA73_16205, partial [Candidatus Hydrogenedentota bacterium]